MAEKRRISSKRKRVRPEAKQDKPVEVDELVTLGRDCQAIQVPSGKKILLPAGTQVTILQSLGGTYAVMTDHGDVVRIASGDSDALGKETEAASPALVATAARGVADVEKYVWTQLRTCYDPEIPVNVVDLGLVYRCQVTPLPEGGDKVEIKFTLTTPGCGMGDWIKADMENKILGVPGVKEVDIEVVFEPPWDQSMMSETAKRELGMI